MDQPRVLIVDDEPDLCELLTITLQRMQLGTRTALTVEAARRLLQAESFDLCLTDMRLPDGDGLELIDWMQKHTPMVPVAVITAHGNMEIAVRALKAGAFDFVSKPLDLAGLRKIVAAAIRLSVAGESDSTIFGPRLLGDSARMRQLRELIGRVARSQAPVHITGESGTGKELVAKLIHGSGPRRSAPFVPVNCGAIPTELMESELFGHKRGSFTGAVGDKKGLIPSAEGGTLFLDEIADLPLHMQVKLLRVIQEKVVRPVGEQAEVPIDVRILSATHKNLAQLVAEGRFREDLYYRINVIELRVPALRERPEDVPDLADAILRRLGRRMNTPPPALEAAALAALGQYAFPGNVRELENILERAVTLCSHGEIRLEDIQLRPTPLAAAGAAEEVASPAAPKGEPKGDSALGDHLEDIERDAIVRALEKHRFNKTAAAKALGMSFRMLRYRIKKLGIE
jgi:two-component system response regulator PilR (NtrC family)